MTSIVFRINDFILYVSSANGDASVKFKAKQIPVLQAIHLQDNANMDSSTPEVELPKYRDPITKAVLTGIDPLGVVLTIILFFVVYKVVKRFTAIPADNGDPGLPRLRKDMTVSELRHYDGTQDDGRVLVAVNGWIFDVTRGKRFYGPGGPYAAFGGTDASRGLATFSVTSSNKEYDDLSDLNSMEMDSVKEWEAQFREKYDLVGRLLKPGEEPTNYSDEEADETDASTPAGADDDRKDK